MTRESTRETRENSLGWMIQRISGHVGREMTSRLSQHDLSLPQFSVLMIVLEHDGLPQTRIGRMTHAPDYAVSRAVDKLVDQGRVERRSHVKSRRAVAVHATDTGRALAPALFAIVDEVNAALVAPLRTPQDRETLRGLLRQILPASDKPD